MKKTFKRKSRDNLSPAIIPARIGSFLMMVIRFKILVRIALFFVVAMPAFVTAAADQIKIEAVLDRDTIGLDEQAVLQVIIQSTDQNIEAPNLPTLPMFEVYSQGRSSNISIVNGAV